MEETYYTQKKRCILLYVQMCTCTQIYLYCKAFRHNFSTGLRKNTNCSVTMESKTLSAYN